jgi:hypothetical protein
MAAFPQLRELFMRTPFIALCLFILSVGPASADKPFLTSSKVDNDHLAQDEALISPEGKYRLIMQGDGNLVVYRTECGIRPECATWQSATSRETGKYVLAMQSNGNLVIYSGTRGALGGGIWNSHTDWGHGEYWLVLQDDGNLVVYYGKPHETAHPVWSISTGALPVTKGCFAPKTGDFAMWLRQVQADCQPATIGGTHYQNVATYTVHFDVTSTYDQTVPFVKSLRRNGTIGSHDPEFKFCGYRINIASTFETASIAINSFTANGFPFEIRTELDPVPNAKAGIEGIIEYRFVRPSTGEPHPNCASDGYITSDVYFQKGDFKTPSSPACGCTGSRLVCKRDSINYIAGSC